MSYEQKDNSGSIFKNDRKETDKHPDSTGSALIGGVEYWVSAWRKTPEGKKVYWSLAFTPKDETQLPRNETQPEIPQAELDDEIPF